MKYMQSILGCLFQNRNLIKRNIISITNIMKFLKKFFSPESASLPFIQASGKISGSRMTHIVSSSNPPTRDLSSQRTQQKTSLILRADDQGFNVQQEATRLSLKLVEFNKIADSQKTVGLDLGLLVGVLNKLNIKQEVILQTCFRVRIGQDQEVSSIRAIRKHSLDSLIIFWGQGAYQSQLPEILKCQQRVIFVLDHWQDVKNFLSCLEATLLDIFGEDLLSQCSSKLLLNLTQTSTQFLLEFEDQKIFANFFKKRMRERFSFLENLEELEVMTTMMTMEQYKECRQSLQKTSKLTIKIKRLKKSIEKEVAQKRKQEEISKLTLKFAVEASRENQTASETPNTTSMIEKDWEVEYFSKRENGVETQESSSTCRVENEALYYFIEEQDSDYSDKQIEKATRSSNPEPSSPIPRLVRTKSWNSLDEVKDDYLDDEFFTKY